MRVDGKAIERPGKFYAAAGNIGGLLANTDGDVFRVAVARFIDNDLGNQYLAGADELFGVSEVLDKLALDQQRVEPLFSAPPHLLPVSYMLASFS